MRPISDQSREFTRGLALLWAGVVALPLVLSLALGAPGHGLPLLGVVAWIVLLRVARWLSPAAYADVLARRGKLAEALAMCEAALAVEGTNAWVGMRRLVWLNRRTTILLALGRTDEALSAALDALNICADPETLGNCALALLFLNRDEQAAEAARLALSLTRERSVSCHAVLAIVNLTRDMPAEAEALAEAGRQDARALLPLVRPEHYALCLAALARALRLQEKHQRAERSLEDLRDVCDRRNALRALALMEDIEWLTEAPEDQKRAFLLLAEAHFHSPSYTLWYAAQPGTLAALHGSERYAAVRKAAAERLEHLASTAPALAEVAEALATAREHASPRPARQSSQQALLMQVATLSGTLVLLLWWTWRFFLVGL